jgi:hypothetical protein
VPQLDLTRLTIFLMENGKSADLKAMARALERANAEGRLHHPDPGGLVHLVLVIAYFRANELDLMKEHYRQLQLPKGWSPEIADWPKIVEAAKEGKKGAIPSVSTSNGSRGLAGGETRRAGPELGDVR